MDVERYNVTLFHATMNKKITTQLLAFSKFRCCFQLNKFYLNYLSSFITVVYKTILLTES
jgi:hypothetical protein